jgi:hypothetical protein
MTIVSISILVVLLLAGQTLWFVYHESFMRAIRDRDSDIMKGGYGSSLFGGLGMILTIVSGLVLSEKLSSALNLKPWLADHLSVNSSGWVVTLGDILFAGVVARAGILLVKLTGIEKLFRRHTA